MTVRHGSFDGITLPGGPEIDEYGFPPLSTTASDSSVEVVCEGNEKQRGSA